MVGGTGVTLGAESVVRDAELFVAVELAARKGAETVVRVASAIERDWLAALFPGALREESELVFDDARERVVMRLRRAYHDLVLDEWIRTDVDAAEAGEVLAGVARADPERAAPLGDADRQLLARLAFLARTMPELDLPADPRVLLADAVVASCPGRRSLAELRGVDLGAVLTGLLTRPQRRALEREAPPTFRLPSERVVALRYDPDRPPVVAARIQELFGLAASPRCGGGRVALVFELLAPNGRPVQVTDDLASFWRATYTEVRKVLRGRYPRHAWPEDPHTAVPTSRRRPS
jgi:ATP-dependent helicase HrpB